MVEQARDGIPVRWWYGRGRGGGRDVPDVRTFAVLSPFVGGDYYGAVIAGVNRAAVAIVVAARQPRIRRE